jgi:hypothetical protein
VTRAEAIAALAVLERRKEHSGVDWTSHLFDKQLEYYRDESRARAMRAGRRSGKSTVVGTKLLHSVHNRPGKYALYLSLTRKSAKRILWPVVMSILREKGVPFKANLTDLEIRIQDGGTLLLGGVDTQDQLERYRGLTYVEAAVDECGSFPSIRLKSLAQDVLRPALMDYRGCATYLGSPGYVPAGYWWELSGADPLVPVYHWTILDNPHIPHAAEELEETRREHGWDESNPTYIREYLGLWVEDLDALIYPYTDALNHCEALPVKTSTGIPIDPSRWRYVIGVDVGVVEATAIVVFAAHPDLPEDYAVHAEKILDMRTDRLASRLHDLRVLFPGPIVCDTQGIGKSHADQLRDRYGLPIEAAVKHEKASAIRILRDRIRAGTVKLLAGVTDELRDEWRVVVWDEQRLNHKRDQDDHCSDAGLYAFRRLRNFRAEHLPKGPVEGSSEWYAQQAKLIEQRLQRRYRRTHGRSPLDS